MVLKSLKYTFFLGLLMACIFSVATLLVERLTSRWYIKDVELRSRFILATMSEALVSFVQPNQPINTHVLSRMMDKIAEDERITAIGFCPTDNIAFSATVLFPGDLRCDLIKRFKVDKLHSLEASSGTVRFTYLEMRVPAPSPGLLSSDEVVTESLRAGAPIDPETKDLALTQDPLAGHLVIIHNSQILERRLADARFYIFIMAILSGMTIAVGFAIAMHSSRRKLLNSVRQALNSVKDSPRIFERPGPSTTKTRNPDEFLPILNDVKNLLKEHELLNSNRMAAIDDWTPDRLKTILNRDLAENDIIVVANREPCIHVHVEDRIEVQFPASGLVTGVEPILRACGGTWIAHGSGSADREVVDAQDCVAIPPENPKYRLHRIWLSQEEEMRYYYGFSNEGMWPLCHITHTRPQFRLKDWEHYIKINERFADAVQRDASSSDPIVLIQDYHFALLPKLITERLSQSTTVTFWHIPWPNSEVFGICPWRRQILEGLLGSSIVGFHTRFHANNFIDTVDRYLECRVERETSLIWYNGKPTLVAVYPISIEWPPAALEGVPDRESCSHYVRELNNIAPDMKLGVGIDRMDYTKGIVERLLAVERLLESNPQWVGKFVFVQIASPSRSALPSYQQFAETVNVTANRINEKFSSPNYRPIVLRVAHHEPHEVFHYLRAADLCFVSSLHDGMNLVAKEFVAAHDDNLGVLVLSMFTGAAHELATALIVNPYDIEQCADALNRALKMSEKEQNERMTIMRNYLKEFNVFRWAGRMLIDASMVKKKNSIAMRLNIWRSEIAESKIQSDKRE